ncbi:MAG: RNA polymerase factor sigma-54 [Bacteroides sp.]|jgi:RNA polymerase sigma-54 factor|nr:RNA polymerase factor sigma-54 [Bacteroides sp.]
MLKQRLQQKLLQKLSPQQIQLMKLLQVPTVLLEQRIKQEIEENPALEEGPDDAEEIEDQFDDFDESLDGADDDMGKDEPERNQDDEFDLSDYIDDDEIPAYRLNAQNTSADDEHREIPFASGTSFQELLLAQLGLRKLNEREQLIATHIIGNIDESGYLQRDIHSLIDDLAFNQNIKSNFKEVLGLIRVIQQFDPPGVGARDLQECLLLQIRRKTPRTPTVVNATLLLEKNFNDFTKKHFDKIQKKHNFSDDELKEAIDEILKLNPKPGNSLSDSGKASQYIVPDFYITVSDEEIELSLNSRNAPDLRINRTYSEMLETMAESKGKVDSRQKEALLFVKQKLDSAKWFIDAIRQRQNTLLVTMEAILKYQKEYFLTGDETKLRPMILKDIADIVKLDISTISRVANSKYVQTPYGTFLLKTFFSESMQNESGEEVSTREVKKILQDCVEAEDKNKPVTDEELAAILKNRGYNIARRTVAKYREQLDIPVARLRKELS